MRMVGGEKKMTMEEYFDFFISKNSINFTIPYLNQIIQMHGFRKLHKTNKKTLREVVSALDLLDLSRSTLKQSQVSESSSASLTLDEVITDIEALKWQECCITSLQIINSDEATQPVTNPKQKSNKRKKPTMKKSLKSGDANCSDENDTTRILALPRKKKKKKKKTKSIISVNEAAS